MMNSKKYLLGCFLITFPCLTSFLILPGSPIFAQENSAQLDITEDKVIYVDPQKGNDNQNGASQELALKTITKALEIAESGTTIKLAWGEYSEETGETFPLIVKKNVALKGSLGSKGHNITIRGNGYFISPTGAGQNVTIAAIKEAGAIAGVTVINPHSRGHGLWIESANPQVIGNTFTRNGNTGVSVNGDSDPLIEDNLFYNNGGNGLLVYGTSQPEVKNNTFEKTGFGVSIVQNAAPVLTGNNFTDNRIGIILEGESQAVLQDNQIENSSEYGLTAIAKSRVDLGTVERPGNNVFSNNGKLEIQNATPHEIVAVGTEVGGQTAGAINFQTGSGIAVAVNNNTPKPLPPLLPPQETINNSPSPLPDNDSQAQELVFTAPPASQPVPYPPETDSSDVLPSPPDISPSTLNSNPAQITSLSDVLGTSNNAAVKYKVLVEIKNDRQESEVRSLYPEAFATKYRGKSALQVGAFTNWYKAKEAWQSLEDLGLNSYLLE
jgi:parallel beta-helix repeat protein